MKEKEIEREEKWKKRKIKEKENERKGKWRKRKIKEKRIKEKEIEREGETVRFNFIDAFSFKKFGKQCRSEKSNYLK